MKCCGYYIGTVRYGDAVANIYLYVVKQDVETLLSGYRKDFPRRALSESEITETIKQDEKQRKHREQTVNKSTRRRRTN